MKMAPPGKRILPSHEAISIISGADRTNLTKTLEILGATKSEIAISTFLRYKDTILLVRSHVPVENYFSLAYYIKVGVPIGKIEGRSNFTPNFEYPRYFSSLLPRYSITESDMVAYTRGLPLPYSGGEEKLILVYDQKIVGQTSVRSGKIENVWPRSWLRR